MNKKELKQFKTELKTLLKKHSVSLSFEVSDGSDTHGIYGEHFAIVDSDSKVHDLNECSWMLYPSDL